MPQESGRTPGFFARLTARMYRALAAAFLPGMPVQPAAAVLSAPPAGQTWKVYYHAPSLVAMREITAGGSVLYYLHQDHLGSTSLATNASGAEVPNTRQSYFPFGAVRVAGTGLPTDKAFTGQYADASTGLYFYNARYYSSYLNRWIQPDTIVPDFSNPQTLNRYAYTLNNPLKYIDPSGHCGEGSQPGEGISQQDHDRLCKLHDETLRLSELVRQGALTDVEALAMILEFAMPLYTFAMTHDAYGSPLPEEYQSTSVDIDAMVYDLGVVVAGLYTADPFRPRIDDPSTNPEGNARDPLGQYIVDPRNRTRKRAEIR